MIFICSETIAANFPSSLGMDPSICCVICLTDGELRDCLIQEGCTLGIDLTWKPWNRLSILDYANFPNDSTQSTIYGRSWRRWRAGGLILHRSVYYKPNIFSYNINVLKSMVLCCGLDGQNVLYRLVEDKNAVVICVSVSLCRSDSSYRAEWGYFSVDWHTSMRRKVLI